MNLPYVHCYNSAGGLFYLKDDEFNKRLGFLTAFFQHYSGMSKNKANKFLAELEVEDEEIKTTKTKHMKGE